MVTPSRSGARVLAPVILPEHLSDEALVTTFKSNWQIGDRVWIDDDESIKATILSITFQSNDRELLELSWFCNGDYKSAYFTVDRVRLEHRR